MSDELKVKLISAANTFVATFVVAIGTQLGGGIEWTGAFMVSIVVAAGRAALKEVINSFLPVKLGGKR